MLNIRRAVKLKINIKFLLALVILLSSSYFIVFYRIFCSFC